MGSKNLSKVKRILLKDTSYLLNVDELFPINGQKAKRQLSKKAKNG